MSMQDGKYKYMFPPKKGEPYPNGCEIFLPGVSSRWSSPMDVNRLSDGSFLRGCWFMRVPVIYWKEKLDTNGNTSWVSYGNNGYPKYTIIQTLRENRIVFYTCTRRYFDTLDEAKNSY